MGEANWGRFHHIDSPPRYRIISKSYPSPWWGWRGSPDIRFWAFQPLLPKAGWGFSTLLSFGGGGGEGKKHQAVTRASPSLTGLHGWFFHLLWWQSYRGAREAPAPTAQIAWLEKAHGVCILTSQSLVPDPSGAIALQMQV